MSVLTEIISATPNPLNIVEGMTFEDARNRAAYAVMATLPVSAIAATVDHFRSSKTTEPGMTGHDVELTGVVHNEHKGRLGASTRRWGAYLIVAAGFSLAGVHMLDPVADAEVTIEDSTTLLIIDQSNSMRYTADMGDSLTRSVAVNTALEIAVHDVSPKIGIGAITYGATSETAAPVSTDRNVLLEAIKNSGVDPNGIALADALHDARNVLAGQSGETKNLVVVTDGIVDNKDEVSKELQEAVAAQENVTIIVTGTEGGSYVRTQFDTEPTPSSATTEAFNGIEGITVIQVTTTDEIANNIENSIKKTTIETVKKPFTLFKNAAIVLVGLGMAGLGLQKLRKRI